MKQGELNPDQKNTCEGELIEKEYLQALKAMEKSERELIEKEYLQALKSMERSKSPGDDGIPVELDKSFLEGYS